MNARAPAIAALLGLAAAGCSDPPPPRYATEADLRFLGEGRATEIIAEVLGEANVQATSGWTIDIGPEHRFDVDVRAGQTKFGLEWVTAQDRVDWGDAIPQPNETGQLQTLAGQGNDADAEILFEHLYAARDRGVVDPQLFGRTRKAAGLGQRQEELSQSMLACE